jgi:hypothetical protein
VAEPQGDFAHVTSRLQDIERAGVAEHLNFQKKPISPLASSTFRRIWLYSYRSLKLRAASENWPWQGLFRRI